MPSKINVDFYILDTNSGQKSLLFACRLLEKAYADQQSIYIHTTNKEEADRIDHFLWTYRDDSFLPHHLYQPGEVFPAPIQIGFTETPPSQTTLFNLTRGVPTFYQQFPRIIEIVFSDPSVQQLARERYRYYRDQGCEMTNYKIKANEL
ncbi:MAG: DNA polymerase III subunit chi [Gammaproteobacteria bacterium]|nr:MAG: DNA polymerase III subunit chi [Gammaproteobacteria bacterium]